MGEQLDLIQGLYAKDNDTYAALAQADRIMKNVKFLRSKVAATQGMYNAYDDKFAALTDVASELDEAVHRLKAVLYLISKSLPKFKGMTLAEFEKTVESAADYGMSEPRSFALLYKLSFQTRTALRSDANSLSLNLDAVDTTGTLRKDVDTQILKLKSCLKLAEIVLRVNAGIPHLMHVGPSKA